MEFDLSKRNCYWFNEIAKIPHGSRNEKGISDFVVKFAEDRGFQVKQDKAYNVMVDKPASAGYENAHPLILQAHMDMVAEKNKDSDHDFLKDPLDLYVEDGWLHARGTTLGADDGMGVAFMLAILEDDTLPHPALECIFTTSEEIGLVGAQQLTPADVHGDRLICLDGGGETSTGVSSAGGADLNIDTALTMKTTADPAYTLQVRGLKGGHSAGEIANERGNAIYLAARILEEVLAKGLSLSFVSIDGGMKDNAIPRECDITFTSPVDPEELEKAIQESADAIAVELADSDAGFNAGIVPVEGITACAEDNGIIDFIYLMPNGFQHRSMAIPGLTLTSLNLGIAKSNGNNVHLQSLARSALDSQVDDLMGKIQLLCRMFGYAFSTSGRYPGWNYNKVSGLRDKYRAVLKGRGRTLQENAGHGGCECGVFAGLRPGIDIITFGAITKDIHSPDEKLDLASFDRTYEMLREIVSACKD